jgi:hypothetical protein
LRYLNAAQRFIFNTHAFPFCEISYSGTLATSATSKAQQTGWQATIGFTLTDPTNTDQHHSYDMENYLPHREFFERFPIPANNDSALPSFWTEFGGVIHFSCPSNKTYTFTQRYYRFPAELTASGDVPAVPEAFREALELYVLYRSEKYRGNHDIAATYKQEFEEVMEQMTLRSIPATEVGFHQMTPSRTLTGDSYA